MRFDVKPILNSPGRSLDFQFTLDLSDTELNGQYPVQEPVEVRGSVRNTAGLLELSMTVSAVLDAACDRCAKPLRLPKQVEFRCMLAETLETARTTRSFCWRTARWTWRTLPARRSFWTWTRSFCVRRTAKASAPAAAPT